MTHTVTVLADHKGYVGPRAVGDEYFVDANIEISTYTDGGEVITAASLGLTSVTAAVITGCEVASDVALNRFVVELSAAGAYESSSSFALVATVASSGAEPTGDLGFVRVRVYGNL